MTYKLDGVLKKITSPIRITEPFEMEFEDGDALCSRGFDRYYLVKDIRAAGGTIELRIEENKAVNDLNWAGEEAVSFF